MKNKVFRIYHPSQLNSLSTLPFIHRNGLGKIILDESFQSSKKKQFESELNKAYHACGCDLGAKALIIGLILITATGFIGGQFAIWSLTKTLSVILAGAIVISIFGKLVGLVLANRRLKQTVREIQSEWRPIWPETKSITCG
jgi:hypothetical protein